MMDDHDDDRPDQGTQHATPVEDVRVTDTEAGGWQATVRRAGAAAQITAALMTV
jgi:hypothetical protein